ncbi:MAG: ROK family protein [Planctomycetia bacterium]|nr:ROK family protein [Planctomycetia bacterium]
MVTPKHIAGRKAERTHTSILAIDVGGRGIKILVSNETESRRCQSGPEMTPKRMVETVRELAADWSYDAVSIGYPGQVGAQGPRSEPGNLGPGWVGFNFAGAFDRPVRIINDAAMQALGSYDGGRMLFLGLGTGLGSALIAEKVIVPLELGQIPEPGGRTLGDVLGRSGMKRLGKKKWRRAIDWAVPALMASLLADYVVLGGGNAKEIKNPPPGSRLSNNLTAFRGGFRLWQLEDIPTLHNGDEHLPAPKPAEWRLI